MQKANKWKASKESAVCSKLCAKSKHYIKECLFVCAQASQKTLQNQAAAATKATPAIKLHTDLHTYIQMSVNMLVCAYDCTLSDGVATWLLSVGCKLSGSTCRCHTS